jgi:hypothetical protein
MICEGRKSERMKRVIGRIVAGLSILTIFLTAIYWYCFIPDGSGRTNAAKWVLERMSGDLFLQRVAGFRRINNRISNFYIAHERMPTPEEFADIRSESEAVLDKMGWYKFRGETYYHYGYETGQCTFIVEANRLDEQFKEGYLPILNNTMTQLEHTWLIYESERNWVNYLEPEILSIQNLVASSTCLCLLGEMKGRKKAMYEEIRNELLQEISENTYDENMCVFSKPFEERIKARRETKGDISAEGTSNVEEAVPKG